MLEWSVTTILVRGTTNAQPMCCYLWQITCPRTVYAKPGSETRNCVGLKSQIAILTLTEASASGKIKDTTGCGSKILRRRMSSYAGPRQRTAWHRWAFLPADIWAQLYNPLHPKVQPLSVGYKTAESCKVWPCVPLLLCWCLLDYLQKGDSRTSG